MLSLARWFRWLRVLFVGCLTAVFVSAGSVAAAQVLELRSQLRGEAEALRTQLGAASWESWVSAIGWNDVQNQGRAGFPLDPAVLEKARRKILARGAIDRRPLALGKTLQKLAATADPLADDQREAYLDELGAALVAADERDLLPRRARLKNRLDRLAATWRSTSDQGRGWKTFLLWSETAQLLGPQPPDKETLTRLEARWSVAPLAWNTALIRECDEYVQELCSLLRRDETEVQRLQAAFAAARVELSKPLAPADLARFAPLLSSLSAVDLGSRLTQPARGAGTLPMLQVTMQPAYFGMNSAIRENFAINGVYSRTRASGNGRIVGQQSLRLVPDSATALFQVLFNGINTSQTTSVTQGVRVNSSATSRMRGSKSFQFRPTGLSAWPSTASAATNLQYTGVGVGGNSRYRAEARSRAYGSRPGAERDTQATVEQGLRQRLDKEGSRTVADVNRDYRRDILQPLFTQYYFQPVIAAESSQEGAMWRMSLLRPHEILALGEPPVLQPTLLQAAIHQSYPARRLEMRLKGGALDQSNWRVKLGTTLAERIAKSSEETGTPWSIQLPEQTPCEFDFPGENVVAFKIHLRSFKNAEFEHDDLAIKLEFESHLENGNWILRRKQPPLVQFLADPATGQIAEKLSGRQISLRSMLRRRIERLIGEEVRLTPRDLGFTARGGKELVFAEILCRDQWLILNMRQ